MSCLRCPKTIQLQQIAALIGKALNLSVFSTGSGGVPSLCNIVAQDAPPLHPQRNTLLLRFPRFGHGKRSSRPSRPHRRARSIFTAPSIQRRRPSFRTLNIWNGETIAGFEFRWGFHHGAVPVWWDKRTSICLSSTRCSPDCVSGLLPQGLRKHQSKLVTG